MNLLELKLKRKIILKKLERLTNIRFRLSKFEWEKELVILVEGGIRFCFCLNILILGKFRNGYML
jgi:hypothetical protein